MSTSPKRVLVVSGPNLDRLGKREPSIYGTTTLDDIHKAVEEVARSEGVLVSFLQSNHEGELVTAIGRAADEGFHGIVMNGAGLTHTSVVLHDAIRASGLPVVEVHITNTAARESFRHHSITAGACLGTVAGFGPASYVLGLLGLVYHLQQREN
ncbi:type II 3-dehydroquinate dehydratase [Polyangium jinanense]|uniref:3-dehydroquinate dehydratase n=1 Tax=Polyangium jinanense TaxID=2829994 RepID=A0A9X3XC19_9BACT|nr:type II 3-dehydroquinate dehydratase [Polyangium jinanense]MDC3957750.1 type II 3-dehydroquinate dehydratase [Polyangium jinanense]MDC3987542.1 type II 3-dehydroquinate dehydratase [Polyangium jinanense]